MIWTRRQVLKVGGALAGVSAAGLLVKPALARDSGHIVEVRSKRISLVNLHTAEHLDIEFLRDGAYLPTALSAIEVLLRDFRTGERHDIDPGLMGYLVEVAHTAGVDPVFSVISGYRSPQTNASLRDKSTGVAQHSLHMEGRAIDVRMSGVDCASLAAHAQDLKRGGVGYYRGSDFVHLDTGAFRTWKG
jgi:uncharacterized protein YcbK (DUF882 family)